MRNTAEALTQGVRRMFDLFFDTLTAISLIVWSLMMVGHGLVY